MAAAEPDTPEIQPLPGQVNPYRTRSELLMDATNYTGVFTSEEAAAVWAEGLQNRSAAMQYTVMTRKLKKEYARQLDDANSNWVTGMSSPWIDSFTIQKVNKPDNMRAEINLRFETVSAGVPYKSYDAKLWIVREGEFWRIERIALDKGLEWYTFYTP